MVQSSFYAPLGTSKESSYYTRALLDDERLGKRLIQKH